MSPGGEGPLTRQIRPKTQIKHAPNRAKLCRSSPCSTRGLQNKDWVETTPLAACLELIFGVLPNTALPMSVSRCLARFNTSLGWFGAFHEGMMHFPKSPLLSTYKRRLSPPHSNNTSRKRNTQGIKSYTTRIRVSF